MEEKQASSEHCLDCNNVITYPPPWQDNYSCKLAIPPNHRTFGCELAQHPCPEFKTRSTMSENEGEPREKKNEYCQTCTHAIREVYDFFGNSNYLCALESPCPDYNQGKPTIVRVDDPETNKRNHEALFEVAKAMREDIYPKEKKKWFSRK